MLTPKRKRAYSCYFGVESRWAFELEHARGVHTLRMTLVPGALGCLFIFSGCKLV